MNRSESLELINFLASHYERFERLSKEKSSAKILIDTWADCFSDIPLFEVLNAIKAFMLTSSQTPAIAEIRRQCISNRGDIADDSISSLWNEFLKITSNTYKASENFQNASPEIKEFLGRDVGVAIGQIQNYGIMDVDDLNTVIKGLFYKQMSVIIQKKNNEKIMPENFKNLITQIKTRG